MTSIADAGSSSREDVGSFCEGGATSTTALAGDADWGSPPPDESANGEDKVKGMTARSAMRRAHARAKSLVVDTIIGALARGLDAFDIFIKVLGPLFMMLALSLFSFETYTFFVYVLPFIGRDWPTSFQAFLTFIGVFLLGNLLYNYLKAIFTDPGCPPWYEGFEEQELENGQEKDADVSEFAVKKHPKCKKCNRQKPPRTHHCSICKRCVLKMDHHCPWVNNCVGYQNYRYFCLFLFYLASCCCFVGVVFFEGFVESMNVRDKRHRRLTFDARQAVSLCWIIAVCIFFALCILGGFHLYLVLTNQTTIEFHGNLTNKSRARMRGEFWRNQYDLGRRRNFREVFGPNDFYGLLWAMPYIAKPPAGDGMSFPTWG